MAVEALTAFPSAFVAGDTLRVTLSDANYPSDDWTLTVYFRGAVMRNYAADQIADNQFELVVPASDTDDFTPGTYAVTFVYESDGERKTEQFGNVEVLPNPTAETVKSITRETLEAAQAAMKLLVSGANQTVSFNGQSFTKVNMKDLQDIIDRLESKVAAEDAAIDLSSGRRRSASIYTRFSRPYANCD